MLQIAYVRFTACIRFLTVKGKAYNNPFCHQVTTAKGSGQEQKTISATPSIDSLSSGTAKENEKWLGHHAFPAVAVTAGLSWQYETEKPSAL